jgi:hypothetical protein
VLTLSRRSLLNWTQSIELVPVCIHQNQHSTWYRHINENVNHQWELRQNRTMDNVQEVNNCKMIFAELVTKFPNFCGTRRFVSVCASALHRTLSSAWWSLFTWLGAISWSSILMLYSIVNFLKLREPLALTLKTFVSLLTYSRSWALLEEPLIVQPLKNSAAFLGTRRFNTVFTRAFTGPYPEPYQSNQHHPILSYLFKIHFNIVHPPTPWSSHLSLLAIQPISYMHSSPPFVLHALPILSFLTCSF